MILRKNNPHHIENTHAEQDENDDIDLIYDESI